MTKGVPPVLSKLRYVYVSVADLCSKITIASLFDISLKFNFP